MPKRILDSNTTLDPLALVLITSGGQRPNVKSSNRIISCSAEPHLLAISELPFREIYPLIQEPGEFDVNIPSPWHARRNDCLVVLTGMVEDKRPIPDLILSPVVNLAPTPFADCPEIIECAVEQTLQLDSLAMVISLGLAVHTEEALLEVSGDIDIALAEGRVYSNGIIREKPLKKFTVANLREEQHNHG